MNTTANSINETNLRMEQLQVAFDEIDVLYGEAGMFIYTFDGDTNGEEDFSYWLAIDYSGLLDHVEREAYSVKHLSQALEIGF